MFNVVIKSLKNNSALTACAMAMFMAACSGGGAADKAKELYNQAEQLDEAGEYQSALALLDSIDRAYPAAVDVRREAMQLRPRVLEKLTVKQLEAADSIAAVDAWHLDSLSTLTHRVANPVESYIVPSAEGHVNVSTTAGLHARMAPDGRFYLIASSPEHISMTSFSLSSEGDAIQAPAVAYDGERNDRSGAVDVITYIEGECQEVGEFILNHRNAPVTVTYNGTRSVSRPLSDAQRKGMADLFETSKLIRARKTQELEKQRLERMLQAVRSQIARTTRDTIPE